MSGLLIDVSGPLIWDHIENDTNYLLQDVSLLVLRKEALILMELTCDLSLYKQNRFPIVAIENGIGLVRQHVGEDAVFLIGIVKMVINCLFFSFPLTLQLTAINSIRFIKPWFQRNNCSKISTMFMLYSIEILTFTGKRMFGQDKFGSHLVELGI